MPTLVCAIELADGIRDLRVPDPYTGVMALITLYGKPVGEVKCTARSGLVSAPFLRRTVQHTLGDRILTVWLEQELTSQARAESTAYDVDVVVCTCDRPDDLRRCLASTSAATGDPGRTIVVDNGSDCATTHSITTRAGARYVREKRRGLDFARNAGLASSSSEFIAYADDDVIVSRNWIRSLVRAFETDTSVACVTGLTMPLELETEAQEFFQTYADGGMGRGYERRLYDRFNLLPAAAGKVGNGANMAFRRAVLEQIGGFDPALDCGTPAKAGGDTDAFARILRSGYRICYEPAALAWHRHRREMTELRNQLSGYSIAVYAFITKCVLEYRDWDAARVGFSWFKGHHMRNLWWGLIGKGRQPWEITISEILGVLRGPLAYFRSRAYAASVAHLDNST